MAAPTYVATGAYSVAAGNAALGPAYPATIVAGDLLLLQVGHNNNASQSPVTYTFPAEFTVLFADTQNDMRQFIYYRIASSTESGTIAVTSSDGVVGATHRACIHQFRGAVFPPGEDGQLIGSAPGSTQITDAAVTTTGLNRLALNIATVSASNTPASFVGETGGDWTLSSGSSAGVANLWLQTATMAVAGTIDGGSTGIATTAWINRGFALISADNLPRNIEAGNMLAAEFDAVGSTAPSFSTGAVDSTAVAFALESTLRIWQGPSNRAVRLTNVALNQAYFVKFGTSDVVAASSNSMLVPGGMPSVFYVPAAATHLSVVSSTTTTINVTLGTVR